MSPAKERWWVGLWGGLRECVGRVVWGDIPTVPTHAKLAQNKRASARTGLGTRQKCEGRGVGRIVGRCVCGECCQGASEGCTGETYLQCSFIQSWPIQASQSLCFPFLLFRPTIESSHCGDHLSPAQTQRRTSCGPPVVNSPCTAVTLASDEKYV